MMEEYSTWCDSEANEKEDAITSAKRTIGELGTEVEELAGKISSTESDLKAAAELRKEEQASFAASEKELVETVDSLGRAVTIMKRQQVGGSFLQQRDQGDLKKVVQTLGKIVEASWVSKKDKAAVQALVQSSASDTDSDEDLSLQPQATSP